jgi:hypothetical protein
MIRPFDEAELPHHFPSELFVSIARIDGWLISGSLARTSKYMLRLFTQQDVLSQIINSLLDAFEPRLLRWLTLSLPASLLSIEKDILPKPSSSWSELAYWGGVLTGGTVTKHTYNRKWDSDIDIFVPYCDDVNRRKQVTVSEETEYFDVACRVTRPHEKKYDFVSQHIYVPFFENVAEKRDIYFDIVPTVLENTERCIECFDMSIVQICYQLKEASYFLTPLALHSLRNKVIILIPTLEPISYMLPFTGTRKISRTIWHYINLHRIDHDQSYFYHNCPMCAQQADGSEGHGQYKKIRDRIEKYAKRFPDYVIIYCKPPDQ